MTAGFEAAARVAPVARSPNRLLALLGPDDFALLASGLKDVPLEPGSVLHDADQLVQHVYFPRSGMISLTAAMQNGEAVETATVGREGAVGVLAGLGLRRAQERAIVQMPGVASRLSVSHFHAAAQRSSAIRDVVVGYVGLLI